MKYNAEIFLEKYRDLEYTIRNKYHLDHWDSALAYLEKHAEFRHIRDEIKYCREVRNLLSHKPKINEEYCVEPSREMIELLEQVTEALKKPPVIMDIAVPIHKVFYKKYEDNVQETLKEMNDHSFGNVPILENGLVKGVLSEKVMLHYIIEKEEYRIKEDWELRDLQEYLLMENHKKEYYRFVKKDALISEVSDLFHDALNKGARIGMIFITKEGKSSEPLLGIVTAWDLAGGLPKK